MSTSILISPFIFSNIVISDGPELLIAFHGFGRSAEDFRVLEASLGKKYTIVAIDLPYHGSSEQPDPHETYFSREYLKSLILEVLKQQEKIRFSLLGYSIGGRIALVTAELFPKDIDTIYLMAPDGIRMSLWYRFASQTRFGSHIYKGVVNNPKTIIRLSALFRRLKFIPHKLERFIVHHLEERKIREQVYNVWISYKELHPKLKRLAAELDKNVRILLILGKYDAVIPPSVGKMLKRFFSKRVEIVMLDKGHRLIDEEMNKVLLKYL